MGTEEKISSANLRLILDKETSFKAADLFFARNQIFKDFENHYRNDEKDAAVELAEEFVLKFPSEKDILMALYCSLLNNFGDSETADKIAMSIININEMLQRFGERLYHLPKILDNTHLLFRFGEMVDQTLAVKSLQCLGNMVDKPVIPVPDLGQLAKGGYRVANASFIPYMSDVFEFVNEPTLSAYMEKIKGFSPFSSIVCKYSENIWGSFHENYPKIERLMKSKNKKPARFKLLETTKLAALNFLKDYGFKEGDDFAVLHLREKGYFDPEHHIFRNVNIELYIEAIKYIIKNGLKIIRIGHPAMTPLPEIPGLIDVTKSKGTGHVDIFACSEAKFYYGSSSGPFSLALAFDTPVACCASLPYTQLRTNSVSELQPLYDSETSTKLNIKEIERRRVQTLSTPIPLKQANVFPGELSSEQNLALVKDILDFIEGGPLVKENKEFEKKKIRLGMDTDCLLTRNSLELLNS